MSKLYRMTYVRPLGLHIPIDAEALEAYEQALDAEERRVLLNELQPPRWKKVAVWAAIITGCLLAWAGIIWGVLSLGDWLARLAEIGWRP